jgi:hypothetical protein
MIGTEIKDILRTMPEEELEPASEVIRTTLSKKMQELLEQEFSQLVQL